MFPGLHQQGQPQQQPAPQGQVYVPQGPPPAYNPNPPAPPTTYAAYQAALQAQQTQQPAYAPQTPPQGYPGVSSALWPNAPQGVIVPQQAGFYAVPQQPPQYQPPQQPQPFPVQPYGQPNGVPQGWQAAQGPPPNPQGYQGFPPPTQATYPTPPNPAMPPPLQPAPNTPPVVPLASDEYLRLRSAQQELEQLRQQQQAQLFQAEQARLQEVVHREGATRALQEQRSLYEGRLAQIQGEYQNIRTATLNERKSTVISEALAGRQFNATTPDQIPVVAQQVQRLLADRFETVTDNAGNMVVRERMTGQDARQVLPLLLNGPEFAHFFKPQIPSGGFNPYGPQGNPSPVPNFAMSTPQAQQANLQEFGKAWQAQQGAFGAMGLAPVGGMPFQQPPTA